MGRTLIRSWEIPMDEISEVETKSLEFILLQAKDYLEHLNELKRSHEARVIAIISTLVPTILAV